MEGAPNMGEVLVVEDTPASLKLLSDLLQGAGYSVRQAPDGELALWSAQARPPELILLDVRMPGIDGYEVCRRLKQAPALRDIPVIFLSAQFDTDDKLRGFRAGAIDFIGKPYQAEEVLARAGAHVGLARSQRALAAANLALQHTVAQLDTTRGQLRRSEHLAALGAMVAGIAHELNTPLGNCLLAASTLGQRVDDFALAAERGLRRSELAAFVADTRGANTLLQRNLDSAASLVSSFKEVASGQDGATRASFGLARLVDEVMLALAPQLRAACVTLEVKAPVQIMLDSFPGALCRVLGELAANALLHGFSDGRAGRLEIEAHRSGERLQISVTDDGGGIAQPDLGRVFEPFFTTRLGQGSSGLGLYIAHNLVANVLGGAIRVACSGGLTRFELDLPLVAPCLVRDPSGRN